MYSEFRILYVILRCNNNVERFGLLATTEKNAKSQTAIFRNFLHRTKSIQPSFPLFTRIINCKSLIIN